MTGGIPKVLVVVSEDRHERFVRIGSKNESGKIMLCSPEMGLKWLG
jgi:hypothetical protein